MDQKINSAEVFKKAFEISPMILTVSRLSDGILVFANDEFERLSGYSLNEALGKTALQLNLYPNPSERDQIVELLKRDKKTRNIQLHLRNKSGELRFIDISSEIINIEGIDFILSTSDDITDRKIIEAKLQEQEAIYHSVITSMAEGVVFHRSDGLIIDANLAAETILGRSRDQIIKNTSNHPTWGAIHEDGSPFPGETHPAMITLHTKTPQNNIIMGILKANGERTWISINTQSLETNGNPNLPAVIATFRDVTNQKIIEDQLYHTSIYNRTLIETSLDPIVTIGPDKKITDVNKATEILTGLDREKIIGTTFSNYCVDPQKAIDGYEHVLKFGFIKDFPLEIKNTNGHTTQVLYNASVYKDENGTIIGVLAVARDITERKLAEERLKELDSIKSKFIRIVSHQLRTPLSAIRWQIESLLSGTDQLSELQKQLLNEAYRANLDIISTINDLTTALDIEEGRAAHLDKIPNSLLSLWEAIEIEFLPRCNLKHIVLETNKPQVPLPLIEMDTEKIRSVMEKFAENALNYTKEKGKIVVNIKQVDGFIRFEIIDTGVGISQIEKNYMFTRFYRGSNALIMKPDSAGLGLYIAKNFVISHGGKIGFNSEEGKGSTFWFELPIKQE